MSIESGILARYWWVALVGLVLKFLFIAVFLWKHKGVAFTQDFLSDFCLSLLDDVFGHGLVGIDWGDAVSGIVNYRHTKKHLESGGWALIVGFESVAFGLEFIPGFGFVAGFVFNVIPTTAIAHALSAKQRLAEKELKLLDKTIEFAEGEGINVSSEKKLEKRIKGYLKKEWPADAIAEFEYEHPGRSIRKKVGEALDTHVVQARGLIENIDQHPLVENPAIDMGAPSAAELVASLQALGNAVQQARKQLAVAEQNRAAFMGGALRTLGLSNEIPDPEKAQLAKEYADEAAKLLEQPVERFNKALDAYMREVGGA